MRKNEKGTHLRHCYQGEYMNGCKYGDDDCPAKPKISYRTGGKEMNYTKGEWSISESKEQCFGETIVNRKIVTMTKIGKADVGVALGINSIGNKYPEAEANAHLISAAPDMYEALKEYIEVATIQDPIILPIFNKIKKAVAKAEGK